MKRVWFLWFLVPVFAFSVMALGVSPVQAQEEEVAVEASLGAAEIEVSPDGSGVDVVERIDLSNVEALEDGRIEHIVSRPEEATIEDLVVTSGGEELALETSEGELLDRVFVALPGEASGDFSYEVSYRYPEREEAGRIPLVVPSVFSSEVANNVSLRIEVPEGEYLHDSFPLVNSGESGESGVVSASMVGFPSYVSYVFGSSPVGIFTSANLYTALTFAVIVFFIVGLLLFDRRSKSRSREVAGV